MRTPSPIHVFACAVAVLMVGCRPSAPSSQGTLIAAADDLHPTALGYKDAKLTAGGTSIDATIESHWDGDRYVIDSFVDGTRMEREIYVNGGKSFDLLGATGESFEPAIPLIKYGMHVGDSWNWKGKTSVAEGVSREAQATVTSASDSLWINSVLLHDVVRIDVTLQLDSGTSKPALRKLQFWFVKDKGIVKRSFGAALIREPAEK